MNIINRSDLYANCLRQMMENSISFAGKLITDGKIHRFSIHQKQNVRDEWYIAWEGFSKKGNPWICCVYGTWSCGGEKYCYKSWEEDCGRFDLAEQEEFNRIWEQKRKELERKEVKERQDRLEKAQKIWKDALELPKTDLHKQYLQFKQVRGYGIKYGFDYQENEVLIIPLKNLEGQVQAVQFVYAEGKKRIHGIKTGNFHILGEIDSDSSIYVTEGYATGATIHEAISKPVVIAFDCGNLDSVITALRKVYPKNPIVICGDDDVGTPNNPGRLKAEEAAKRYQCKAIFPSFPADFKLPNGKRPTDFNDLHCCFGIEAIKKQFFKPSYLQALNIAELLSREFPPRKMVLSPWLPERGLTMIYAPRGIGKTFLSLFIAYAIACGASIFNWIAEEPRKVLYIDGEMPAASMQQRLSLIARSFNITPEPSHFKIVSHEFQSDGIHDLATQQGQCDVNEHLKDADVVIIDNLSTLIRAGNENEADSWVEVQEWLLQLRKLGKTVIIIHHAGKNGAQRGTSKREDILDTVIALRKSKKSTPNNGARFEVHFEKTRGFSGKDAEPFEAFLTNSSEGILKWITKKIEGCDLELVIDLYNDGMRVQRDLSKETGMSLGKINGLLKQAKADGMI